ncbi:hypothetical protein BH11PSE13_BH11PSE13_33320 [soil metagenome]
MESIFVLLVLWAMILCYFGWVIYWRGYSKSVRMLKLKPTEDISSPELFSYLLSGNLALIEKDNFNQIRSSLSIEQIRLALFRHWQIKGPEDFSVALQQAFFQLGDTSAIERQAFDAWNTGAACITSNYIKLFDVCKFLSVDAGLIDASRIGARLLDMTAWDIQRTAYLVRLGYASHYIQRDAAAQSLRRLSATARAHYDSWGDFSLSALIGMGTRSDIEVSQTNVWHAHARTHLALTSCNGAPFEQVSDWKLANAAPKSLRSAEANANGQTSLRLSK